MYHIHVDHRIIERAISETSEEVLGMNGTSTKLHKLDRNQFAHVHLV
jgi:hypothetical protein